MGWLTELANPAPAQAAEERRSPGPGNDFWYEPVAPAAAAGVRVDVRSAMRVPAFRRGVTVLAGSIASLPVHVYEKTAAGKQRAPNNPLDEIISSRPNAEEDAYTFWEARAAELILFNHAYAEIVPGRRGAVDQLIGLMPEDVRRVRLNNGRIVYDHTNGDTGRVRRLTSAEVFHLDGFKVGHLDESVIEQGADTLANAIALARHAGSQWRNGVRLSGVLEHPELLNDVAAARLRQSWQQQYGGYSNAGKTAVLEEGMTFKELSQKNNDAQLYEQWAFYVEEIARLLGVPTILVGRADKASTYASAEQFFLSFVTHSLMPWLDRIQKAIRAQLIIAPQRYFAEFSVQGLLRGDHTARANFYQSGITAGWLTPNEARQLENLNRKEGGDSLYRPLNVEPADAPFRQPGNGQALQLRRQPDGNFALAGPRWAFDESHVATSGGVFVRRAA